VSWTVFRCLGSRPTCRGPNCRVAFAVDLLPLCTQLATFDREAAAFVSGPLAGAPLRCCVQRCADKGGETATTNRPPATTRRFIDIMSPTQRAAPTRRARRPHPTDEPCIPRGEPHIDMPRQEAERTLRSCCCSCAHFAGQGVARGDGVRWRDGRPFLSPAQLEVDHLRLHGQVIAGQLRHWRSATQRDHARTWCSASGKPLHISGD